MATEPSRPSGSRLTRRLLSLTVAVATTLPAAALTVQPGDAASAAPRPSARKASTTLDLGVAGLPETRKVTRLATGVTLTTIVRGQKAATVKTIATTPNGPWRVNVVTIDPRTAKGQLRTAIGSDIVRTEGVSTLARWSRSTVAVNGSYFSEGRKSAPGDMVGLAVNAGTVISQPQRVAGHMGVLMDSRTKKLSMDNYSWRATVTSDQGQVALDAVNSPLTPPAGCENLTDATQCPAPGSLVRYTTHYAASTPSGPGAEVVFGADGCAVSARPTRGARLGRGQTSIQATGQRAAQLLRVAGTGCPTFAEKLTDTDGRVVPLSATTFGVVGRYRLVRDGQVVAPAYRGPFFGRNPRTLIGRTASGSVVLATIDGRSTMSVGATLAEEAGVARSLGLVDAVNLDGGGSTAMAVRGKLVNRPSAGRERPVGDAVVLMP